MKNLKILIANNTLSILAGSETWSKTLALQLKKMGHVVEGFSPELGIISEELEREGIPCFNEIAASGAKPFSFILEENHKFDYDLIIANHNHIVDYLRAQFPRTPIISTVHGIIHEMKDDKNKVIRAPEHPALEAHVQQFVSVSEEVQAILRQKYNLDSIIIRNFFDVKKFEAKRPVNPDKPKMFLINTNYSGGHEADVELIRKVAKDHYGAKVAAVGFNFAPAPDMMMGIEDADVVVGMGRSVLEGVCAGRLGIVNGRWGTGGVINPENIDELKACNFSGRNSGGELWTAEKLIEEIDKYYNQKNIDWGKQYARTEHNVVFAAEEFVKIGRSLIEGEQAQASIVPMKKYRRARDVKQQ